MSVIHSLIDILEEIICKQCTVFWENVDKYLNGSFEVLAYFRLHGNSDVARNFKRIRPKFQSVDLNWVSRFTTFLELEAVDLRIHNILNNRKHLSIDEANFSSR